MGVILRREFGDSQFAVLSGRIYDRPFDQQIDKDIKAAFVVLFPAWNVVLSFLRENNDRRREVFQAVSC